MRGRALLAALAGLAVSCAPAGPPSTFLLLTIDTLRADRLGAYGCPRGVSPELDRLAAGAAVFTDCVSVSSWTMPAMGTLATGLRPNDHGMVYWHLPLRDVEETLAEALGRRDVATAFFGNPIPGLAGLDRGFEVWETFEGDDRAAVEASLAWLEATAGKSRFVWVHLLSPHAPYDPLPGTARPDSTLDPRTVLYDGEVLTADLLAGRLLAAVGPAAAVAVTADHGETLDERSELQYDHGKYLFDELLRIPCVVRLPETAPRIAAETVTLADLPVTVCDWFGARPPKGSFGASLLPAVRGKRTAPREPTFAQVVEDDPPGRKDRRWSVRRAERKAVFNLDRETASLYDLAEDPGERRNVAKEHRNEVEALHRDLEAWRAASPDPKIPFHQRFSPEELERLQALGYLGGAN